MLDNKFGSLDNVISCVMISACTPALKWLVESIKAALYAKNQTLCLKTNPWVCKTVILKVTTAIPEMHSITAAFNISTFFSSLGLKL